MLERQLAIHENTLANMADGVLTLDLRGQIQTFNPAAGRILRLAAADLAGKSFAELFLADATKEPFNELVLRAIYDDETVHSAEIELPIGGAARHLAVTTSFLRSGADETAARHGVIVVLSDITERRERQRVQRLFGEYVDPRIIQRILDGDATIEGQGQSQVMTAMFCDMAGFTALSERLEARALVAVLNGFLGAISAPIGSSGGIIDKYIGDAVMAFWGPPFSAPDAHASLACAAALEQRTRLAAFRAELGARWPARRGNGIDMRTGIATGAVVAGNVGPEQAKNYTVIGDPVNVAARLERLNKRFGTRILVAEDSWREAEGAFEFRELDLVGLRGRARPERVFELLAERGRLPAAQARLRDGFEAGLAAYRAQRWAAARDAFARCLERDPNDRASRRWWQRIDRLLRGGPAGRTPKANG